MRSVENELAESAVRAWVTACSVDDGPTDEQLQVISAMASGYFGLALDLAALEPLMPAEASTVFHTTSGKHRLLETMIVLELTRHPGSAAQADLLDQYAEALQVEDGMQHLARDYVADDRDTLAADFGRFASLPSKEPHLASESDEEIAAELEALAALPPGTLGREFDDFYKRNGLDFPVGDAARSLVSHDMSHVLGGYEANPIDEVALQAMLASATDGEQHFSSLMASLSLFEIGMLPFDVITPKVGVMARPGAPAAFAEGVRRGALCTADFGTIDHFAVIDQAVEDLRAEMHIVPRLA